jgi:alkylation response protein AidB-like acyl-CoA dehydrogenase
VSIIEDTSTQMTAPPGAIDAEAARSRHNVSQAIGRLESIAPALAEEIEANEQAGKLTERTLELLRESKVPSLLVPESLGGLGMFPRDALEVLERLCQIDASIGWIGANWSATGLMLGFLEPDVGRELLAGEQPLFGASGAPSARAVPVDGGYNVTGAWSYGSGDLHADYVIVSAIVSDENGAPQMPDGKPIIRSFVLQGSDIVCHGNWDTLGLRATGSVDFTVWAPARSSDRQLSGGIWVILCMLHTSFSLGAARRLLDELTLLAQRPSSRGNALVENPIFRDELARQEIAVRSARAFVFESWDNVDAAMKAGRPVDRRMVTLLRASMVHMHDVAKGAATFVFSKTGGTSLRVGTLQRWVRDTLSGCQHVIVSDSIYPDVVRELIGAPENLVWTPFGLAEQ